MYRCSTLAALLVAVAIPACSHEGMRSTAPGPVVVSVAPANGAVGVSPSSAVVVTFSQPMMRSMERNVVLHEGSIAGPAVAGGATWSAGQQTLTFVPAAPLRSSTTYVLHLAPTMMAQSGARLDHAGCSALGGTTVTSGMMGHETMGGGMMDGGMAGSGWDMMNGSWGMSFVFTTS